MYNIFCKIKKEPSHWKGLRKMFKKKQKQKKTYIVSFTRSEAIQALFYTFYFFA